MTPAPSTPRIEREEPEPGRHGAEPEVGLAPTAA